MISLSYAIVVATRNRPEALRLSLRRMLVQTRKPSQLIVIDSSDNHAAVVRAVEDAVGSEPVDLIVRHSERGASLQRNLGLEHVRHPVVFFPDDDSIWFPDAAEKKMAVYEQDAGCEIAAVCGVESKMPPQDFTLAKPVYAMRRTDRLKQRFGYRRSQIEGRVAPDPAKIVGGEFRQRFRGSRWHEERHVVPVEWMTGFRMSFRTEVIRAVRFDEVFTAYSLFEDIDASFGAWRMGAVVGVRDARVFHYKSPERRDDGRRMGAIQLLNKAYVVAKHTPPGHLARRSMGRFSAYKQFQYLAGIGSRFGRDRFSGARAAGPGVRKLLESPPEHAPEIYRDAVQRLVESGQPFIP